MLNGFWRLITATAVVLTAGMAVLPACGTSDDGTTDDGPTPTGSGHAVDSPVTIGPSKDITLYEDETGSISSGSGPHLIAGMTNDGFLRRALIAFDIAGSVPAGSTIQSVTLTMNMSRTNVRAGPRTIELHAVTVDWGEGASDASLSPGKGTTAAPSDATWLHRFHDTTLWETPGGDFSPTVSAGTEVTDGGTYTWDSTPQMVSDVQGWLDDPANNFGWLLLGDESVVSTAKRFDSRETFLEENGPVLVIEFAPSGGS